MRLIAAALAGAAIFLGGCDGNGAPEEESRTETNSNNTEESDADSDGDESAEEADQE